MTRLGYVPSNAARMMRSNRSGLIGLITGAISYNLEPMVPTGLPDLFIVQGIQRIMSEENKTLMIADTGGNVANVPKLIRTFLEHRVEGLIYAAGYHKHVQIDASMGSCPLLLVNCFDDIGTRAILPDDRDGQKSLGTKLIQSGHTRIGFLMLDRNMIASQLRLQGYRGALSENGVAFDKELTRMAYEEGREQDTTRLMDRMEAMLSLPNPPGVLCCGNDEMALRVYGLLRSRGVRIPEDISVTGFDNYRVIAETLFPPLTTVELPYLAMGQVAARELLVMIGGAQRQQNSPTLVSGPVAWRSSVTVKNSVSLFSQGRKNS